MKRDFFYKIKVEVDEPPKGKDGNAKSDVQDVLNHFESAVKAITIKKGNTKAVVKNLTPSSPDESTGEEAGNQRFLEEKKDSSTIVSGIQIYTRKDDPLQPAGINYISIVREKIQAVLKEKNKE